MVRIARRFQMLRSLRFSESTKKPDVTDKIYDRQRKQRTLCDMFGDLLTKFLENLRTFGSGNGYCEIQRLVHFQMVCNREALIFQHQNLQPLLHDSQHTRHESSFL